MAAKLFYLGEGEEGCSITFRNVHFFRNINIFQDILRTKDMGSFLG